MAVPKYMAMRFPTIEEFNDYITSPDYQTQDNKGVCMAIEFKEEETNKFDVKIHFNDKKIGISKFAYSQGMPD